MNLLKIDINFLVAVQIALSEHSTLQIICSEDQTSLGPKNKDCQPALKIFRAPQDHTLYLIIGKLKCLETPKL